MALLGKSRKKPEPQITDDSGLTPIASLEVSHDVAPVSAEQEIRTQEAKNIIKNHVIGSMGISLVPIPLVDLFALTGIQLRMLHQLAKLYRVSFSENLGKSLIISLVGGVMPTSTAITLASFVKAVPGLGTATGIVSVTLLGGATSYAVGSVFMQHFESGGTLLNFEPKSMREHFAKELRQGKQVAANLKKSK
jgi:uncharacterized protein (DUF697 family)